MFICTLFVLGVYNPISALYSVFQLFSNEYLLLLPFRFPFFNVFLFSLFLSILSLALTVVDPSLQNI